MSFFIIPGVYRQELDLSTLTQPISTSLGAMAFPSRRGTMSVYFETDSNEFTSLYGPSDFTWTFAHSMIKAFLTVGKGIYLKRVTNSALHAGSIVSNDINGVDAGSTRFMPFPSGREDNYSVGGQQYQNINFSGPVVTGNSIAVVILSDYNDVIHTFTQVFVTDSDTTLRALAAQINTALITDPFIVDDKAVGNAVLTDIDYNGVLGTSNDRNIYIVSPEGTNLTIESITITGGSSAPTATVATNPWLFEVWAENPGIWADRYGYQIRNIDQGIAQRVVLKFSDVMGSGSSFKVNLKLKGVNKTLNAIPFHTDMPTTALDIANALFNALGNNSEVYVVEGSNGLQIQVISPIDGPNTLEFTAPVVSGGSNNPQVTATQNLTGIASSQTFDIYVYSRDNVNSPIEKHKVSFIKQTDGNGRPLFIEDVINRTDGSSNIIRVRYNQANGAATLNNVPIDDKIHYLHGGFDGILPTNGNIAGAWFDNFSSRKTVPCRLLINGGYSSPVVQQQMDSISQARYDCFSILDTPSATQDTAGAVDYRNNVLDINSSYSAMYTPDVLITDDNTSSQLYIPPSGHVAAQFAYNDAVAAEWFAPAGLNRGLLQNIQGLAQTYDDGQMASLISAQINPIIKEPGKGYQIKSANTLQAKASALSNINVRRLLITIEVSLVEALDYSIYEPNTAITRFLIVQLCTSFLQPIKDGSGLYDYAVICDSSNNPSYLIDEGQCDVDVYLKPVIPIKYIQLTSVITKTGAYFQEIIAAVEGNAVNR